MNIIDKILNFLKDSRLSSTFVIDDFSKVKGESTGLEVGLIDVYNNIPLRNKPVTFIVNGKDYSRVTDDDGVACLDINLPVGVYPATVMFDGDSEYKFCKANCNVIVSPCLFTTDLNCRESKDNNNFFKVFVCDTLSNPLPNVPVTIGVNGKDYEKVSDENGVCGLNINLNHGDYEIVTRSFESEVFNKLHIDEAPAKPTRMEGTDMHITEGTPATYQCAVYDDIGRIEGRVKITINNKTYDKIIDNDGLAYLNINLAPGTYNILAEYEGNYKYQASSITNSIIIDPKEDTPVDKGTWEDQYSQDIFNYFVMVNGDVSTIDEALEKWEDLGYSYFYDDQGETNKETIDNVNNGEGTNCTNACQVMYHIAKVLGYDVHIVHVGCSGGDGHVRLQLKHPINTDDEWINRDPAAVLADNGQGVTYCWCMDGVVWDYDPDWFMESLYD